VGDTSARSVRGKSSALRGRSNTYYLAETVSQDNVFTDRRTYYIQVSKGLLTGQNWEEVGVTSI
jgi:hypothetical protein